MIERKVNRHLEMMNHLTSMRITGDNMVSVYISMFYAQIPLYGVLNHLAERRWGYENLFYARDGGMKLPLIVRNYSPPRYPGLKMTAPLMHI